MSKSLTQKVFGNAFWLFIGGVGGKIIEFVTYVYLARVLTAQGFGLFSLAHACLLYLLLLVDGGFSTLGIREVARNKQGASTIGINILSIRLTLSLIVVVLSGLVLFMVPLPQDFKLLIFATFLIVIPNALSVDWILQGLERMELVAAARILPQIAFVVLAVIMVKGINNLLAVPLIEVAAYSGNVFIFISILAVFVGAFRFNHLHIADWKKYFMAAAPLGLSAIFIQIYYSLDIIMLGLMRGAEVAGWYSAIYKLFYAFLGTVGVVSAAAFPVVCKRFAESKSAAHQFLEKYLRLMFLFAIPAILLGIMCAKSAILLIYGTAYLPGATAFIILLFNMLIIAGSGVLGSLVLVPSGKTNEFMLCVGLGAFCNILLNFILIPLFSLNGAAAATLMTEIIVGIAFYLCARQVLALSIGTYIIKPALAGACALLLTVAFGYWVKLDGIWNMVGTVLVFVASYIVLTIFNREGRFLQEFVVEIIRGTGANV